MEVIDCDSNLPLAEVSVFYQTNNELEWNFIGNTSNNGLIKLDKLPANATLMVTTLGYKMELITIDEAVEKKSVCLKMVEIEMTNLTISANINNPFITYKGGKLKNKIESTQRVRSFMIQAKEVSISEFAEFVKETGYVTEVEKQKPIVRFVAGIELSSRQYLEKFKRFSEGSYKNNRKNKFEGFEWIMVIKRADSITWKHDKFGRLIDVDKNNIPVVNITYNDALAYANWLGGRLPLIEEYAWIRQNDKRNIGWNRSFSGGILFPVGTSPSNKFGVYDIYGNAAEYIYHKNDEQKKSRVFDMGYYSSEFSDFKVTEFKDNLEWLTHYQAVGFRVVREVEE
jgi:formylglycine-generating enzyme required for sulfatase activity